MPSPLVVINDHPLKLEGIVDSSSDMQFDHDSDRLSSYNQTLHAYHDNLNESSGTMQIRLFDFSHGGASWDVTASHVNGVPVAWSQASGYSYCDFGALTDALEIDVLAVSDAVPPQSKTRKIWIKTMPTDALPDEP